MSNKTCHDCRYWSEYGNDEYHGDCRFNAPLPVVDDGPVKVVAVWPTTCVDDWCGKLELKESP